MRKYELRNIANEKKKEAIRKKQKRNVLGKTKISGKFSIGTL